MRGDWEREYTDYVGARLNALHRQAYALTGNGHHADDLVQQTCTDLYVYWKRARDADNLDGYVRTMLIRAFLRERQRAWFSRVKLTPLSAAAEGSSAGAGSPRPPWRSPCSPWDSGWSRRLRRRRSR